MRKINIPESPRERKKLVFILLFMILLLCYALSQLYVGISGMEMPEIHTVLNTK